jgi:hypothetical protein
VSDPKVDEIGRIAAPYRREIVLQNVLHESGMRLLRVRIREGTRFTILDIDAATATTWGEAMTAWASSVDADGSASSGAPTADEEPSQ